MLDKESAMKARTKDHLFTAMHGEAFAYAKFMLYADHARAGGNAELAALFEETAKVEFFKHFAEEAKLAGLVGKDADNLKDAIKGEDLEAKTVYRKFAEEAEALGDLEVARHFAEVRRAESVNSTAFGAALEKLESVT
ncbi:MAG TPA: ferritin family protein [Candidatus Dormibacteraeota bacterium]|nr:ferritin family protein [Candidatus Dormibacteraeota bacterium]